MGKSINVRFFCEVLVANHVPYTGSSLGAWWILCHCNLRIQGAR